MVKKGNGTTTTDSIVQTITVTKAAAPTGVGKTDCSTAANNNGTITGVSNAMEYRKDGTSTCTTVPAGATTVTGLTNGTYEVRVKASGSTLASDAITVTISAYSGGSGSSGSSSGSSGGSTTNRKPSVTVTNPEGETRRQCHREDH